MTTNTLDVQRVRSRFPGLTLELGGAPAAFFDGPAGSQVPQTVLDAVTDCMARKSANLGGAFPTSVAAGRVLEEARGALADLLGAGDPNEVVFGANMTSLTFDLSRCLERTWRPGDEIVVTRLDHDANVTPWVLAAQRAGVRVRHVAIRADDCTLDLDDLRAQLCERTRLVAFGAASNLVGTINPVAEITSLTREVGALSFVDAVHYAPHRGIDVVSWGCDFVVCSAYKFFGPHVGVLWGRRPVLQDLPIDKLRPVDDTIPDRFMHGTQNHEGIAGTLAAVEYLATLGQELAGGDLGRRDAVVRAFEGIDAHERGLSRQLLEGLSEIDGVRVVGIRDPSRLAERVPTVSFCHARHTTRAVSEHLGAHGVFTWHGNSYALPLTEALALEPHGVVRVGCLHYNTGHEVERLLEAVRALPV